MRASWILALWLLAGCAPAVDQPVLLRECVLHVQLGPQSSAKTPYLVSEHTEFDPDRHPLTRDADGQWSVEVVVPPGRNLYWIEVDGDRLLDRRNPLVQPHDGALASVVNTDACERPQLRYVERTGASTHPTVTLVLARARSGSPLDPDSVRASSQGRPLDFEVAGDHLYIRTQGLSLGKHWIEVTARDDAGAEAEPFTGPIWLEATPFSWADALIYQIVVDRFAGPEDLGPRARARPIGQRMGGTLSGVTRKLEEGYFNQLGISALWLSPLYKNPDGLWVGVEGGPPRYGSYHGYWPIEPRALDERVGSEADLEALVDAAHGRGIRVIVDVVPNHVHEQHIYREQHPEWFPTDGCICGASDCPWWREIQTCWFTPYLPDVDWSAEGALVTTVDDMVWWMERFNLDGLRVDAVPMIPRFVTRHLARSVHERFEQLGTRHYLVGETFTGPEGYDSIRYPLGPDGLDGQFDFPFMWALRNALAWESVDLNALGSAWARSEAAWRGSASVMATMVGNHDVTRFISEAFSGGLPPGDPWTHPAPDLVSAQAHQKLRLAQTMVLTLPGAPVLYYGDEVGQPGARDPDNRRPMRFDGELRPDERETLGYIRRLGRLRACMPALRRGTVGFHETGSEQLSMVRSIDNIEWAWVLLQRKASTDAPYAPTLARPWSGRVIDALTGERFDVTDGVLSNWRIAPYTARVLVPEGHPCLATH